MTRLFTNNWTLGFMFALGLIIAGSDGDWFPYANFIGVLMIGYVGLVANWLTGQTPVDIKEWITSRRPAP